MATIDVELSDVEGLKDEELVTMAVVDEDDLPWELICSSRLGLAVLSARAQTHTPYSAPTPNGG